MKQAELETLIASQEEIGEDRPDGNFFARTLSRDRWERPWMDSIARVVLVHRLREVAALAGFTRFEALAPDIEGELEMGISRAALARDTTWLPAIENKGEGIFLQFKSKAVASWEARTHVQLPEDVIGLVTTGPEAETSANRDTLAIRGGVQHRFV